MTMVHPADRQVVDEARAEAAVDRPSVTCSHPLSAWVKSLTKPPPPAVLDSAEGLKPIGGR
jgi:hypothetical protein